MNFRLIRLLLNSMRRVSSTKSIGLHLKIIKVAYQSTEALMIRCRIQAVLKLLMTRLSTSQPSRMVTLLGIYAW